MSTTKTRLEGLLAANAEFAASYTGAPVMTQMRERVSDTIFVLTCMDPRAVPEHFLGPSPKVGVFRNAGGRYSPDVVRSITILRSLAYRATGTILMVVHHTDCGMTHLTDEKIKGDIRARGAEIAEDLSDMDFSLFTVDDVDKAVVEDVEKFKADELLKGVEVKGYVLSNETGQLREVQA